MKTIQEVIDSLEKFKKKFGKDTKVLFSFNGSMESGELIHISSINSVGLWKENEETYNTLDYDLPEHISVEYFVEIHSDRENFYF